MTMFFYVVFYIVTAVLILSYLITEKKVVSIVDAIADKFVTTFKLESKLNITENIIKIVTIVFLFILGALLFRIDYSVNPTLPIKTKVLYFAIFINMGALIVSLFKKYYFDFLIILDIILLVFAKTMFGIDDINFVIFISISILYSFILMYLINESITRSFKRIFNGIYLIALVVIIQGYYLGNYVIPTGSMEPTILIGDRIFANNVVYKFKAPKVGDIIAFKEPMDNNLMFTKRITGAAGDTFKISDENGHIYLNGQDSNLGREYSVEGLVAAFGNPEIYIPKKNDKVKLSKILEFDSVARNGLNEISVDEFLSRNIPTKYYPNIFGIFNSKTVDDKVNNKRYTYTLEVEGQEDKLVLPILDFKYDAKVMEKLLNGESITLTDNYYMAMGDNTTNSNDSRFFGYVKESRIYGKLLLRWYPFNRLGSVEK